MPTARPIIVMMKTTKLDISIALLTSAVAPDGDEDREQREHDRQPGRDRGAEDDEQDHERHDDADHLALLQRLLEQRGHLALDAAEADGGDAESARSRSPASTTSTTGAAVSAASASSPVSVTGMRTVCPSCGDEALARRPGSWRRS